jgi:hypothetical protein
MNDKFGAETLYLYSDSRCTNSDATDMETSENFINASYSEMEIVSLNFKAESLYFKIRYDGIEGWLNPSMMPEKEILRVINGRFFDIGFMYMGLINRNSISKKFFKKYLDI